MKSKRPSRVEARITAGTGLICALILICGQGAVAQDRVAGSETGVLYPDRMNFYNKVVRGSKLSDDMQFYDVNRELVPATSVFNAPYTVVVSGCLTCGQYRTTYPDVEALYRDYKDKGVDFYFIYQTLMHPENHGYVMAYSMEERFLQLDVAIEEYQTQVPWILDTFDNNFKALTGAPNGEFIFSSDGTIVHAEPLSQAPSLRNRLESLVGRVENPTSRADLDLPDIERLGMGYEELLVDLVTLEGAANPIMFEPEESDEIYYAKMRPEVDGELLTTGTGQMYLGFHVDPIYDASWNNLVAPVLYELTLPDGTTASPARGEGARPKVAYDTNPREFLIDIENWDSGDPMGLEVFYFACNAEVGWCKPVTQRYTLKLTQDQWGGEQRARTQRPRALLRNAGRERAR